MASAALLVCPELGLSQAQREELSQTRQKPLVKKLPTKTCKPRTANASILQFFKGLFINSSVEVEGSNNMEKLPNELLEEIFCYLDARSVRSLREVNKRCKNLVDGSKKLMSKFEILNVRGALVRVKFFRPID